jgi:hypothetical protein
MPISNANPLWKGSRGSRDYGSPNTIQFTNHTASDDDDGFASENDG